MNKRLTGIGFLLFGAGLAWFLISDRNGKNSHQTLLSDPPNSVWSQQKLGSKTESSVIIGRFVSANYRVSVHSNGLENRFSVATVSGDEIASMLDEESLQKLHPQVYNQLKTGIAGFNAGEIWAGNDLPYTKFGQQIMPAERPGYSPTLGGSVP